jgi:predicted DNA binding CopG/RHH family protein
MRPKTEDRSQVKEKRIQVRITEPLRKEFKEHCAKNGIKVAQAIEQMIRQALDNDKEKTV